MCVLHRLSLALNSIHTKLGSALQERGEVGGEERREGMIMKKGGEGRKIGQETGVKR